MKEDNGNRISAWLSDQGYRLVDDAYRNEIDTFRSWYKGKVSRFHEYTVCTGTSRKKVERYALGMAKTVCEDYASLLLNEQVSIEADGFKALPDILAANRFYERGNRLMEWVMALGTGAFVEFLDENGMPTIDYIRGDMIYPLRWEGDSIIECAFGGKRVFGSKKDAGEGYYIQIHEQNENGMYVIRNVFLNDKGKEIPVSEGVTEVSAPSPVPLFQILRPNIVNSIDPDSPMGMSVYGAAIDQLKACDLVYDSYVNEFVLGKKRLMVPMSMAQIQMQRDGTLQPVFDPNDVVIQVYQVPDGDKDKLQQVDMTLRSAEHEAGLQRMIDLLSKKCGLGTGRYRFDSGVAKTATEVISQGSDLYQSVKRNEKPITSAITGMVQALSCLAGGSPDVTVTVAFDDSIFEDSGSIITRNIALVGAGLKSKRDAIMEIEHCDEKQAEEILAQIKGETTLPDVGTMFGGDEDVT